MGAGDFLHGGNGGKFKEGSESKHLLHTVDRVEERYMPQHTQVSKMRERFLETSSMGEECSRKGRWRNVQGKLKQCDG